MFKLNTQKTIKDIENNFIKTDLPVLKIGDNVKMVLKLLKVLKKEFNLRRDNIARKIVQLTLLLLSVK
jgi:ribosomal protein L19